jgi:hypothetical protein
MNQLFGFGSKLEEEINTEIEENVPNKFHIKISSYLKLNHEHYQEKFWIIY